jgi:4-hydroxybenzoate polyprenyltransferase
MPLNGKLLKETFNRSKWISFLKLIRFQNLLIIAVTQYMMRFFIIKPFLTLNGFSLQLNDFHFFLLVLTSILIAASGYVINDYFDVKTDRINKPDRVFIDKLISRGHAIGLHIILNFTGIAIGIYLSWYINVLALSLLFMICSGLLWFYSTSYKKQFLIGNLLISLLTGGVPLLVALYEIPLLNKAYGDFMIQNNASFNYIFFWIAGFSFFAFLTNFIREIIKDTEDFEGDSAGGMKTIPIVLGINTTKTILIALLGMGLIMIIILMSFISMSGEKTDYYTLLYFITVLIIPIGFLIYNVWKANDKHDYQSASTLLKFIMIGGVLYSAVVRYIVLYTI